jgi:hypothetical protein
MLSALFWIAVGLVIGWNFPQPKWVKELWDKFTGTK